MDLDFLVSRYDRELDRKDTLTGAVGLPVTILAVLGGVVAAVAQSFVYGRAPLQVAFVVAVVVFVVATGNCLFWLARNYMGSTYLYLPRLHNLDLFRQAVIKDGEPSDIFDYYLEGAIIEATDANAAANDARTAFIDRANQALIAVLIAAAVCGGIYVLDQVF